jgi:hypothetical protein
VCTLWESEVFFGKSSSLAFSKYVCELSKRNIFYVHQEASVTVYRLIYDVFILNLYFLAKHGIQWIHIHRRKNLLMKSVCGQFFTSHSPSIIRHIDETFSLMRFSWKHFAASFLWISWKAQLYKKRETYKTLCKEIQFRAKTT